MYAIFESGGHQFQVEPGDEILVELLKCEDNQEVEFSNVLLVHDGKEAKVGMPFVGGAKIRAQVLGTDKEDKVIAFKYKRRKRFRKKIGHRQKKTRVRILGIDQ